jgi:hypothetical protein
LAASVVACVLVAGIGASAAVARAPKPLRSTSSGVRFTGKVIAISRSLLKTNLIGISADGTFEFRHAPGPIGALRKGKVMLIPGVDALNVRKVVHRRGKLFVHTVAAKVTDLISSGKITFSGTPDVRSGSLVENAAAPSKQAERDFVMPAYLGGTAHAAGEPASFSASGNVNGVGYSLTFTPASSTRLDIAGSLCFSPTPDCGNSGALNASIAISGYIGTGPTTGAVTVKNEHSVTTTLSVENITAKLKFAYHITNVDGSESNPPVIQLPVSYGMSVPSSIGVPLYVKTQFVVAMSFGLTKGATENGGVTWQAVGGLEALKQAGGHISTSQAHVVGSTEILDLAHGEPVSFAPTASGSAITIRLKLGVGLGVSAANVVAYVDWVEGLAQEIGSAVVGQFCSSYYSLYTIGAGVEAQIGEGALSLSGQLLPRVELFRAVRHAEDPGCPPISGAHDIFGPGLPSI